MGVFKLFGQISHKPPVQTADFAGKCVIVTGANAGLGKEAVKQFVRRGAAKVIATVRSNAKGKAALEEIEADTKRPGVTEIWELDYSNYASVRAFGAGIAQLDRLDAVVLNAGVATKNFEVCEGQESSITVNVISTTLLTLLLLPILRASAAKWDTQPTLTVVCSEIHTWAKFPERKAPNALQALSDPKTTTMRERYPVSKLLQLLAIREIAARTLNKKPLVILNLVSPGLCSTDLTRSASGTEAVVMKIMQKLIAWTAEEGSRTLFHATVAGPESHGVLLDACELDNDALAPWITTEEGKKVQKKFWVELAAKLEGIQPEITRDL